MSLAEIEQIPFKNLCEEVKSEDISTVNSKATNNITKNISNNNSILNVIKNNKNKGFADFEEMEKQIKLEVEINKDLYIENLSNVRGIMFIDEDKKLQKKSMSISKTPSGTATPAKENNLSKSEFGAESNSHAVSKEEYVDFVLDFVANIILENKIKN